MKITSTYIIDKPIILKKMTEMTKSWKERNPERVKQNTKSWQERNKDKFSASTKKWASNNKEAVRAIKKNRRLRKSTTGLLSNSIIKNLLELQRGKCACGCKKPLGNNYHLDHIMPLALGGTNTDDNIQLLRAECNLRKSAKHPIDFMQSRGFLL